jgi:predicted glycosyltransferase
VPRSLRIVLYGVNGSGVGHLVRLASIARWMRRLCLALRVTPEITFLTTSEADALLFHEGFPSFKLPSKTAIEAAGHDKLAYIALAKQWIWHSLGLLRPDLLVVDTFPRGAFGELLGALDLVRARAFVYRPMSDAFARRPDFQAMLPLYDLVAVPDDAGACELPVPPEAVSRLRYTGPIVSRERVELLSRDEARRRLGVGEGRTVVYASAGGGGDENAEKQLGAVFAAFAEDPSVHLVVGAGPLYRGRPRYGERVSWVTGLGVAEHARAFDVAISAAGYNSFFEWMHLGVPSVFLPQPKVADEQDVRARRAVEAGAARVPATLDPAAIREAARALLADREAASRSALALVPRNHARTAAAAMLRLVLPPADVDAAEAALSDDVLAKCHQGSLALEQALELASALEPEKSGRESAAGSAALATDLALEWHTQGLPFDPVLRVVLPLGRKLVRASASERAEASRRVVAALAPFADWSGAAMLVRALASEKELTAVALSALLERFAAGLRASGEDLYDGLERIARVQAREPDAPNATLLAEGAAP